MITNFFSKIQIVVHFLYLCIFKIFTVKMSVGKPDNAETMSSGDSSVYGDVRPENPVAYILNQDALQQDKSQNSLPSVNTETTNMSNADLIMQITTQFTDVLTNITDKFNQNSNPKQIRPPTCTFSGLDHEDPEWFLNQINAYFRHAKIVDDVEKILLIEHLLRGNAKKWYENRRYQRDTYAHFENRFINMFNSQEKIDTILAKLYGDQQGKNENVADFITHKRNLFLRLQPDYSERAQINAISSKLRPEFKYAVRSAKFNTLDDFQDTMENVEKDWYEMSNQNKHITMGTVNPRNVNSYTNPRSNFQIPQREYRTPYYEQQNYAGISTPGNLQNLAQNVVPNFNVPPPNFTQTSQNVPVVQNVQKFGQIPNNKPRTPCKFCHEWHFHSQCLQNPFRQQPPPETNINRTQVPKN